ncbi:hypothetical protein MJO29_000853 [Puccinia striiformis f. sp. tritici]|uniref:hypothetical protein n=1 Tax=Puccinia striiformis f. sp. tritici TaxID=168172 RepID=UPI0020080739|nr:hypothetical protein Pst134EA_000859 [Puccinia striiformis f. sp. tritici]KAH9473794.1 hypothetical protein Pst134EA_000859 [Puccinia striiformis f. sp. tritici]KAI7967576.1 hypothetical protein MJO29_000853 [Puccinia striiformis f. sp. tritici]
MASTRQVLTIGGLSFLTAGLTYCLYFDYKRRNDPVFRKELLKEQRRLIKKNQYQDKNASRELEKMLEAAVATVNAEPLPTSVEGKEQFFMEQVGIGEMLASKMPRGAMPAAIAFFKAYKVYPSPQELLVIYQRTMPPEIFAIIIEMIKLDVNRVINSAKNSYRSPSHRGPPSSDGPVIEEITGEERALIDALKSVAGSGPSPSAPAKPTSDESKPSSSEESKQAVAEHPVESSEGEFKPPSDEEETPKSISENPSLEPNTETSSAAHSENGSATGASQTANSFVLVEDDSPAAQDSTSEETATPIEPELTPSEEIVSEDQAQEDAPQETEKEPENESEEEPENESEEELVQEELEHTTVEAPVAEQTQE